MTEFQKKVFEAESRKLAHVNRKVMEGKTPASMAVATLDIANRLKILLDQISRNKTN